MKKWLLIIAIVGAVGAGGWAAFGRGKKAPEGQVVSVVRGPVQVVVQEVGSIEPFRKIEIKAKVSGQVREVLVDVGDSVKASQPLIRLEPLDAEREAHQSEARVHITEAQLQQQRGQSEFKKRAHEQGALSDAEWSVAEGDVKRLEAQLELDRESLNAARDRLSYTQVKSPIDGVVLSRNVQPGELVVPGVASMVDGKPLLVVAQMEKLLVRAELNQIDVARLHLGGAVSVTVDALPGKEFHGEIYRMAAMAQKSERRKDSNLLVFPVDVVISRRQADAEALRPGMIADIRVKLDEHPNVLTVPLEAVVRDEGKTTLWKVADDKTDDKSVEVVVGLQNDRVAEIISGVTEGEKIRVRPGDASAQTAKM